MRANPGKSDQIQPRKFMRRELRKLTGDVPAAASAGAKIKTLISMGRLPKLRRIS
jgi:hypothetical protein